jgi:hypothetical protein
MFRLFSSAILTASSIDSGVPCTVGAAVGAADGVGVACPEADRAVPETNRTSAVPVKAARAIEARIT